MKWKWGAKTTLLFDTNNPDSLNLLLAQLRLCDQGRECSDIRSWEWEIVKQVNTKGLIEALIREGIPVS